MKIKYVFIVVVALFPIVTQAKDKPLDGKEIITHDYGCVGVSAGDSVSMTVGEVPGSATVMMTGEGMQKPVSMVLQASDDQTRVTRMYSSGSSKSGEMILEVADITKMATITMLHFAGSKAFTAKVCYEKE